MEKDLFGKILGCLAMVAIGDALGMPAHDMTMDEIKARFGGHLRDFRPPPDHSRVHRGMKAGQITDDTILTLALAQALIERKGALSPALVAKYAASAYRTWAERGLSKMFGPSTRQAVEALEAGLDPVKVCAEQRHPMGGASNGGAMKISPVGLIHPGDMEKTVQDVVTVCLPSHGTQTGIAAASAVACGISEAMKAGSDVLSVVRAALNGARTGEAAGRKSARIVPLPSVAERIQGALQLVLSAGSDEQAMRLMADRVGTGLASYESIPAAIGLFFACDGDPLRCAVAGASVGFDTDTIASMAGALAGALKGFDAVPRDLYSKVVKVNGINLEKVSEGLERLAIENLCISE